MEVLPRWNWALLPPTTASGDGDVCSGRERTRERGRLCRKYGGAREGEIASYCSSTSLTSEGRGMTSQIVRDAE
jgi:hypothetical protein